MAKEKLYFVATTPKQITPALLAFCRQLDPSTEPVYIDITPHPEAIELLCYSNCQMEIADHGGEPQRGWMIFEYPDVYAVAEHHCVVKRDGKLICVTPQPAEVFTRRILFLPSDIQHDCPPMGTPPARYAALVDHPIIHKYVELVGKSASFKCDPRLNNTPQQRLYEHEATMVLFQYQYLLGQRKERIKLEKHREQRRAKKKQRR